MYNLEEFPPQRKPPAAVVRHTGSRTQRTRGAVWPHLLWLAIIAATVAGGYFWMHRRVAATERELAEALNNLDEAKNSLRLLWTVTARLDAAQVERQDVLENSIDTVKFFVEGEVSKLWQAAYLDHSQRLDENTSRINDAHSIIRQLRNEAGQAVTRIDALVRQSVALDSELRNVESVASTLRNTLTALTQEIARLDGQLNETQSARLAMDNRLNGVEQWVNGYRTEGLSARAVQTRFASLVQDLQRITLRVDSLRLSRDTLRTFRSGMR